MPVTERFLAQGAHQPGALEISHRHQDARGADDDRRQRPSREAQAHRHAQREVSRPAELLGQRIAFEQQVGCGDPGAEQIHPAREREQSQEPHIRPPAKWHRVIHSLFLPVNLFRRFQLRLGHIKILSRIPHRPIEAGFIPLVGRRRRSVPPGSKECPHRSRTRCP